jgi:hypothetical protein
MRLLLRVSEREREKYENLAETSERECMNNGTFLLSPFAADMNKYLSPLSLSNRFPFPLSFIPRCGRPEAMRRRRKKNMKVKEDGGKN